MTDAMIYTALTLIPEVADEVALGAEAVNNIFRFVNLNIRSLDAQSGRWFGHRCFVTVFRSKTQFKFNNDNILIWTPLYRVIVQFKGGLALKSR